METIKLESPADVKRVGRRQAPKSALFCFRHGRAASDNAPGLDWPSKLS